jgi:hypothetical protein
MGSINRSDMSNEPPPADRFETDQRVDTACPSCPCRFSVTVRRYERHVRCPLCYYYFLLPTIEW